MLTKLIPHKTELALQQAGNEELYASNLYQHLANQCQRLGLFGAAKYFKAESLDEREHYQGIADYLNDLGAVAEVGTVEACDEEVADLESALQAAFDIEKALGQKYANWYQQLAGDPMAQQFLLGYLEIQRKSIGEVADWLQRLTQTDDPILVDKEMGA